MMAMKTPEPETVTRYVGNCQICEGDQKLHMGKMVHHGYKRPGDGYILGDCSGVHQDPYEVSCEAIKAYKAGLERNLVSLQASLEKLLGGEVTHLSETHLESWKNRMVVTDYHINVTSIHTWNEALAARVYRVRMDISYTDREIARCAKRIADWKLLPLRTVEEELAKDQAAKALRTAEVEAKRAARDAKRAAIDAKHTALEAARQVIREGFIAKFRALADQEITEEVKRQAIALARETCKAKHKWLWIHDLGLEEVFVKLGLAEAVPGAVRGDGRIFVRYGSYFYR